MELLPADALFYYRAATTWMLCATVVLAIVGGWIGGRSFRTKKFHLAVLFWCSAIANDNLRLRLAIVQGNLAAETRLFGGGREAVGVSAVVEHFLLDEAYIWVLARVAAVRVCLEGRSPNAAGEEMI